MVASLMMSPPRLLLAKVHQGCGTWSVELSQGRPFIDSPSSAVIEMRAGTRAPIENLDAVGRFDDGDVAASPSTGSRQAETKLRPQSKSRGNIGRDHLDDLFG